MKKFIILLALIGIQSITAQKHFTRSGTTNFKASVQAFEPIEATNTSSSAILSDTGDFAALLLVKGFHFKIALMQEHFNENYMESNKFPAATFKGRLDGFSFDKLDKTNRFVLQGVLTIKGKEKKIKTIVLLFKKPKKIVLKTSIVINPVNFGIKIPALVRDKIAQEVKISINYELKKN